MKCIKSKTIYADTVHQFYITFLSINCFHLKQNKVTSHTDILLEKQLRSTQQTVIKMPFIKQESEDMNIEEAFRVKQEPTEEQIDG